LSQGKYINGFDLPTIADLVAYNEIAQMKQIGVCDYKSLSVLCAWMEKMSTLPENDNVHQSLFKLGQLGGLKF
jgi:hypothetical protein